jgi:uncharacterized phage protein gp47/JayE
MATVPAIDYTNKDYRSLRQALLDLARYRMPEWTDQSPADLGMLLVDLFAYVGDVTLYYQDRVANESFLHTAEERRSILHLLRLIDYELRPPVAASADLDLVFNAPAAAESPLVVLGSSPGDTEFAATASDGSQVAFTYLGPPLTIDVSSDQVIRSSDGSTRTYRGLPVRHARRVGTETLGSSTGEPNQRFKLGHGPLLPETLVVEVNEGAGWIAWTRCESFLYNQAADGRITFSAADARDYTVQFDEQDAAWIVFGDGTYGRRPPAGANNIRAAYYAGGGASGNVPAGAIRSVLTPIRLLASVANPLPAAGGADHEPVDHAVKFGPLAYRSGNRAVTLSDYVALAHRAGGVAKVRARSRGWNQVELYVAPEGPSLRPVPESLRRRLVAYFEDKRMIGTFVSVLDATPVPIEIELEVLYDRQFRADDVRRAVQETVRSRFAFDQVDFEQSIYISDVYAAVENTPGVFAVTIRRFQRQDEPARTLADELGAFQVAGIDRLPAALLARLVPPLQAHGRIEIGAFEIPVLSRLDLVILESPR